MHPNQAIGICENRIMSVCRHCVYVVLMLCLSASLNIDIATADELEASVLENAGPVITFENSMFTIFGTDSHEHQFYLHSDGHISARNKSAGTLLQLTNGNYEWTHPSGVRHHLQAEHNDSAQHQCEEAQPHRPPEQPLSSASDNEQQCDIENADAHSFQAVPYTGPQMTLDARPESCESYFVQYYGTQRGFKIETGVHQYEPYSSMQSTIRTFPVIDFMDDANLYVVHSRDLGNRTFNSPSRPNALLDQLLADGEEIQTRFIDVINNEGSISAEEMGQSTTITSDQMRPVTLQLVIRDGIASADHWRQIETARVQLQARHGITLEVVVIP